MTAAARAAEARARLADLLARPGPVPLGEAVACFGVEEDPVVSVDDVVAALDDLARGLSLRAEEPLPTRVARLIHHLHTTHRFTGDTERYDDPTNSVLHTVIARRRGLPILLAVVAIEVAERAGLTLDPIGFPGHFLVSPRASIPRFYLDPFHDGRVFHADRLRGRLEKMGVPPEAFEAAMAPVSTRAVLVRMCHNLRRSLHTRGDVSGVARVQARLDLVQSIRPSA